MAKSYVGDSHSFKCGVECRGIGCPNFGIESGVKYCTQSSPQGFVKGDPQERLRQQTLDVVQELIDLLKLDKLDKKVDGLLAKTRKQAREQVNPFGASPTTDKNVGKKLEGIVKIIDLQNHPFEDEKSLEEITGDKNALLGDSTNLTKVKRQMQDFERQASYFEKSK
jgi:hypothetical protein